MQSFTNYTLDKILHFIVDLTEELCLDSSFESSGVSSLSSQTTSFMD